MSPSLTQTGKIVFDVSKDAKGFILKTSGDMMGKEIKSWIVKSTLLRAFIEKTHYDFNTNSRLYNEIVNEYSIGKACCFL